MARRTFNELRIRTFYLLLFAGATYHVDTTMTVDGDLPVKRDILSLSFAIAGLTWYSFITALGLFGCWSA